MMAGWSMSPFPITALSVQDTQQMQHIEVFCFPPEEVAAAAFLLVEAPRLMVGERHLKELGQSGRLGFMLFNWLNSKAGCENRWRREPAGDPRLTFKLCLLSSRPSRAPEPRQTAAEQPARCR